VGTRYKVFGPATMLKPASDLAMEFMALAYESAGSEVGMGALRASSGIDSDNIGQRLSKHIANDGTVELYGDYIAGRMVKTGIIFNDADGFVEIRDRQPDPACQGWATGEVDLSFEPLIAAARMRSANATRFDSYDTLLLAAAEHIGVKVEKLACSEEGVTQKGINP
jgi:hypothetical protein